MDSQNNESEFDQRFQDQNLVTETPESFKLQRLTPQRKLKFFVGNAIFWAIAGYAMQAVYYEVFRGSVYEILFFHGVSIFFVVSLIFIIASLRTIETNSQQGYKLVRTRSVWDLILIVIYLVFRAAALAFAAFWLSIGIAESIEPAYGYAGFALVFFLPFALIAMLLHRRMRTYLVKRGVLVPLTEGLDEKAQRQSRILSRIAKVLIYLLLLWIFMTILLALIEWVN